MKCCCCDVILTPQESVRKFRDSGEYTDTCSRCLRDIPVPTVEGAAFEESYDDYDDTPFDDDDLDEI
jgi:uncharacterized metal-binding protein YceD (DUF177 family)